MRLSTHMEWMARKATMCWALAWPCMAGAQLVISQAQPPATLVQNVLLGPGVFANNMLFNDAPGGSFPANPSDALRIGRFNGLNSNIGLANGVILATGNVYTAVGPNNSPSASGGGVLGLNGDPDLLVLSGAPPSSTPNFMKDVAKLEFNFIPMSDMVRFRFVFASEEYPDYVCSSYNDAFGFFLRGPGIAGPFSGGAMNIAMVPGTLTPITINTLNSGFPGWYAFQTNPNDPMGHCNAADPNWQQYSSYFVQNGTGLPGSEPYYSDPYHVQYNGFTVVLEASAMVQCGQQYHIKLAVADANDHIFDSAVFLEQGSFMSVDRFGLSVAPGPNVEYTATDTIFIESDCDSVYLRFHRHGGYHLDEHLQITVGGTATPGEDYLPPLPSSVHFAPLDTMVTVAIAVPVDPDDIEDLIINLITCDGLKIQTYVFLIDQRPPLEVALDDVQLICPGSATLTPEVTGGGGDPAHWTYLWSTSETTPSITVQVSEPTQFWVTVSDSCWALPVTDSAWVFLPEPEPLIVQVPADTAVACMGTATIEAIASGGSGGYSFEWVANGSVVGTTAAITVPASPSGTVYTVTITDQCGATATASLTVGMGPTPPLIIEAIGDTVMCPGMEAVMQVISVSGGGGVYSFQWSIPPGPIPGSGPSISVPVPGTTWFNVVVSDQCGNSVDTTLAAVVLDHPPLTITYSNDTIVCPGEPVSLWVEVEGGAGDYTIVWPGLGTGSPILWTAVSPGIIAVVQVVDQCGTMVTGSIMVDVHPASVNIVAHQQAEWTWGFTAVTDPPSGNELLWDLGDGTTATGTHVVHTYTDPDAFWVVLYMITPEGCIAVDSIRTIPPEATIYFPNAFTPDGDGFNDTFGGSGILIERYELLVFDRWGRIVFESNDITKRWDGRFPDGEEVPTGVYPYRYRVKGLNMPLHQGYGHVTLLR